MSARVAMHQLRGSARLRSNIFAYMHGCRSNRGQYSPFCHSRLTLTDHMAEAMCVDVRSCPASNSRFGLQGLSHERLQCVQRVVATGPVVILVIA